MPVRITSKKDGFRRCGIEHPAQTAVYPDDRFTDEELARFKAEPMLIVEVIAEPKKKETGKKAE